MGILMGLISMFGWGTGDFLAALASRKLGNIKTLFGMQTVSFLLASLYFFVNFNSFNMNSVIQFLIPLFFVAFFQFIAYMAFYQGLKIGMVSIVSPIGSSFSLIVVILSVIFYHEALKSNQIIGILIILIGIIFLSINIKELIDIKKITVIKGAKEGLIAMFGWGISLFLIVPASKVLGWFLPVYIFRLFVILILLTMFIIKKQFASLSLKGMTPLLLLGVGIFDIAAFFSFSLGVASSYASIVASVGGAFTMVTTLLAWFFLKEKLSRNQLLGIFGIVAGIVALSV